MVSALFLLDASIPSSFPATKRELGCLEEQDNQLEKIQVEHLKEVIVASIFISLVSFSLFLFFFNGTGIWAFSYLIIYRILIGSHQFLSCQTNIFPLFHYIFCFNYRIVVKSSCSFSLSCFSVIKPKGHFHFCRWKIQTWNQRLKNILHQMKAAR